MSRKRKPLPPRHKRLTRQGRLQAAKHGCDPIQVKTSLGDIESILESIHFARFENYLLLGVAIDPA